MDFIVLERLDVENQKRCIFLKKMSVLLGNIVESYSTIFASYFYMEQNGYGEDKIDPTRLLAESNGSLTTVSEVSTSRIIGTIMLSIWLFGLFHRTYLYLESIRDSPRLLDEIKKTSESVECGWCQFLQFAPKSASIFICYHCHCMNKIPEISRFRIPDEEKDFYQYEFSIIQSNYFKLEDKKLCNDWQVRPSIYGDPENTEMRVVEFDWCDVCMDHPGNMILLPCGHGGLCDLCATKIVQDWNVTSKCPHCRTDIETLIKLEDMSDDKSRVAGFDYLVPSTLPRSPQHNSHASHFEDVDGDNIFQVDTSDANTSDISTRATGGLPNMGQLQGYLHHSSWRNSDDHGRQGDRGQNDDASNTDSHPRDISINDMVQSETIVNLNPSPDNSVVERPAESILSLQAVDEPIQSQSLRSDSETVVHAFSEVEGSPRDRIHNIETNVRYHEPTELSVRSPSITSGSRYLGGDELERPPSLQSINSGGVRRIEVRGVETQEIDDRSFIADHTHTPSGSRFLNSQHRVFPLPNP